ncbi:adhesion G protein-coupled receptor A3 isoform X2 [Paramormyrops kingsleyae]|uniref:Adhesion G protein-coupled receptor A1 n=1 Tax=Paramormyrops kingsleyae TaxID=1676925 RepID=A0A3B3TGQ4_9TELE|nr:adhesion G protein-coupled receptor A1 isoform X2 [Paramormyrops kingsleyae]
MMRLPVLLCVAGLWRMLLANRSCPDLIIDSCRCTSERSKELTWQHVRVKVACNGVELLETLQPSFLPNRTVSLILSNNKISILKNDSFFGLSHLERLDLKNNLISTIEPGAFHGLTSLRRLDLSNNRIGCFSPAIFTDLGNLLKLNISGNIFSSLPEGLFTHLMSLKILHFSSETLFCDCHLGWLLLWTRANSVHVGNGTCCIYPTHLHGLDFRQLKESQLKCDGPLELPLFQLIPSQRQLVFPGDRLPLQCTASYLDSSVTLQWSHNRQVVHTQEENGIFIEESIIHDCCLITSELILSNIDMGASGDWACLVTSIRGNSSRSMEIVVLETSTLYCPAERVTNNKGQFRWLKTLAGVLAFQPCKSYKQNPTSRGKKAWRRCDRAGNWAEEDYSQCPYTSEVTRVLHELSQMAVNVTNAQTLAQQLSAFTSRAAHFNDMMDVIYVTHILERLIRYMDQIQDLADYIADVASNMMQIEEHVLWMAQNEARACTRIVQCVERIADVLLSSHTQAVSKASPNIALKAFMIKPSDFVGLSCAALQQAPLAPDWGGLSHGGGDRPPGTPGESLLNFTCNSVNLSSPLDGLLGKNTVAVVSIQLPLAGTPRSPALQSVDNSTCKLHFIVFRNGKLFPCTGNSSNLADDGKRRSVSTPVAFTKLDGCRLGSLSQSITIALRHFALGVDPTAAYWDFDLLDGHGGWRAEGCHITGSAGNTTVIHCTRNDNFAVLMDLKKVLSFPHYPGEFLHPVVYACTAVMLLCLFASIITYIVHHSTIRISRKGWHMLLNFSFHTALTFAVFAGGINRIKNRIICQAVGIVLHYSTLSTMLWLGVTARNIYKQVTKTSHQTQDGDPPPNPKQPMLRFYLVSGGVPFIICGITAATNIDNYDSGEEAPYCWMVWEPSLGAFYGPVAFIVLVTCVYFLCTFLQLKRHPERKYELRVMTVEQQRLATAEVGHCHGGEPGATCPAGHHHTCPNASMLANEHSFKAQLRAAAFTLFLFLATWTFGALAVSQGYILDLVFSCLYGAFSVTLGLFVLIHHCAKRDDVWHCWCSCCPSRRNANTCGSLGRGRPKVNINGDTQAHCHLDPPCLGHVHGHAASSHCKLTNLQSPVACLSPAAPCCSVLHSQQLLEDEPHVHLHRCLRGRTKPRHFSRHRGGAGEREYAYHISSSVDGGSVHSSHSDSPRSSHERPRCHTCHRHMCCAKADLFPTLCQPEGGDAGTPGIYACGKMADDDLVHQAHMEMHSRRQSYPQNPPNQNGILKSSLHEGFLYSSDSTGNIRTGPWKNETTV